MGLRERYYNSHYSMRHDGRNSGATLLGQSRIAALRKLVSNDNHVIHSGLFYSYTLCQHLKKKHKEGLKTKDTFKSGKNRFSFIKLAKLKVVPGFSKFVLYYYRNLQNDISIFP